MIDDGDTVESDHRDTVMGDTSLLLRAAIEGQGIALGQASLVADLIKAKQLVAPVAWRLKTGFGYYLVYPQGADARPEIELFKEWIVAGGEEGVRNHSITLRHNPAVSQLKNSNLFACRRLNSIGSRHQAAPKAMPSVQN